MTTPTDFDLIDTLRLRPGDSIEKLDGSPKGNWVQTRRTLLWQGDEIAVWSATSRWSWRKPLEWSAPIETANPCGTGDWQKVDA